MQKSEWELIYDKIYNFSLKVKYKKNINIKSEELLNHNRKFKDRYKGKRCFIVGNGPSIKQQNIQKLQNEIVFVCNEFIRYEQFKTIMPKFYLLMDPLYFTFKKSNKQDANFIQMIASMEHMSSPPSLWIPLEMLQKIKIFGWDRGLNIHYINNKLAFWDGYIEDFDFTRLIPGMYCVVHYAIMLAIYMGFSEIYLLGVEQTNILHTINKYLNNDQFEYVFDMTEDERKWMRKMIVRLPLEVQLNGYTKIFHGYNELNNYCHRKHIKLRNCTPVSLIDSIKKIDLDSVLAQKY